VVLLLLLLLGVVVVVMGREVHERSAHCIPSAEVQPNKCCAQEAPLRSIKLRKNAGRPQHCAR
jgi:hypothetical protein